MCKSVLYKKYFSIDTLVFNHYLYDTIILYFLWCFWRSSPFSMVSRNHIAFSIHSHLVFFSRVNIDCFCYSNNAAAYTYDTKCTKKAAMDLYGDHLYFHMLYLHCGIYRRSLGSTYKWANRCFISVRSVGTRIPPTKKMPKDRAKDTAFYTIRWCYISYRIRDPLRWRDDV